MVTLPKHFQTVFFVCNKKKIVDFCFFEWFGIQKIFRTVCSSKKNFRNTSTTILPQNLWFFRMVKYSKRSSTCIWKNSTNFEKIFSRIYQINSIPKDNILYFFWESYAYYNQWGRNRGWSEDWSSPKFWKNNNNIWKKWVPILP